MRFIQLVELTTEHPEEIEDLVDEWLDRTKGRRTALRGMMTRDRERPNTYIQIVEFDSYEDAMANSELPETAEFAEHLAAICESGPSYRNLDVERVEILEDSAARSRT